jgi:hypothetical protein
LRAECATFHGLKTKTFNTEDTEGAEKNTEEKSLLIFLAFLR